MRELLRFIVPAADHENRVVAADRADHGRHARVIERDGERLRLARIGLQHDELLNGFGPAKEFRDGPAKNEGLFTR